MEIVATINISELLLHSKNSDDVFPIRTIPTLLLPAFWAQDGLNRMML